MIRAKICMLGAYAVGKTSLVQRYVQGIFRDVYQTTVGVHIHKHETTIEERDITLMVWDIHGEDDLQEVRRSYIVGSTGYLLVADGTRPATLEVALQLHERAVSVVGDVPFALLLNKADLTDSWDVDEDRLDALRAVGVPVRTTSAKDGSGVVDAFEFLARGIVPK